MRSSAIRRYITQVGIYSVLFLLLIFLMDYVFNGVVLDFLYSNLPSTVFHVISRNQTFTAFFIYTVGLVIISVCHVFRFGWLLSLASKALTEESPVVLEDRCPEELRDFSQNLKDFKFELKENERARLRAEQQKNDLIVYLAHDLKTPLTSVIGYLSLLEDTQELPLAQRTKYVQIALDKAYRLEQLINEFFEITRLNLDATASQKAKVNLTILLLQKIEEFFPMLEEKRLQIRQQIEPEICVLADGDKLARVFDNLFRNAVNYSDPNTQICCFAYRQADRVIVTVRNKGDDISQEKLDRIFDKFYRIDSSRRSATGGSGLGLAIVKQIVEAHNGTITASCTDGVTEFRVELPV